MPLNYTHRVLLSDRTYKPLIADQAADLEQALRDRKQFWQIDKNTILNVPRDVVRIEKMPFTQVDLIEPDRRLAQGRQPVSDDSPGYQSFLREKAKLQKKLSIRKDPEVDV